MKTADLYRTVATIDKAIKGLHETGQKLQLEMHKVACSVLKHYGEHKDLRVVLRMIDAMPAMARVNGLKMWFEKYAPIAFNSDGTAVVVKDKAVRLGDAMAEPFWKLKAKEGEPYKPVNVDKMLDQMIAKLKVDKEQTGIDWTATINALQTAKTIKAPLMTDAGSAGGDPLAM